MHFRDIISALENEKLLPITPQRIAGIIKSGGVVHQIVFVGVDLDTEILRGAFARVRYENVGSGFLPRPYEIPEDKLVIKIYYARNQPEDFIRVVLNKELIHSVDPDHIRVSTKAQAATLIQNLRLPLEMILGPNGHFSLDAFVDQFSDLRAVAAMVPSPIRTAICEKYAAGKITESEIAMLIGIPLRYVRPILSDRWDSILNMWRRAI